MTKSIANRDSVFAACELLSNKNEPPTIDKVLKEIGGGSRSTVAPLLKEWRERNPEKSMAGREVLMPIPAPVMDRFNEIWNQAVRHSEGYMSNEIEQTLEERLKTMESSLREAAVKFNTFEAFKALYDEERQKNDALTRENERLRKENEEMRKLTEVKSSSES